MTDSAAPSSFSPLRWIDGRLQLIDQTRLPGEEVWVWCETAEDVARAIRDMLVRGAPAIGCAAAYGVALAARRLVGQKGGTRAGIGIGVGNGIGIGSAELAAELERVCEALGRTRPTAVNLFWALGQMREVVRELVPTEDPRGIADALERRAVAIHAGDAAMCRRIGTHGAELVPVEATVLTHCNAGALATGGYGTALGVIRAAREAGKRIRVIADETRPFLQGSRLTAWELAREGFDVTVVPDGAAPFLLRSGEVSCVIVGADRIAANGDVANKIGTYAVALGARAAGVPFYVAAPRSTIDLGTPSGDRIPIEERAGEELLCLGDLRIAAAGVSARYPAFDITPAELVDAIITDLGVARPPYGESLVHIMKAPEPRG